MEHTYRQQRRTRSIFLLITLFLISGFAAAQQKPSKQAAAPAPKPAAAPRPAAAAKPAARPAAVAARPAPSAARPSGAPGAAKPGAAAASRPGAANAAKPGTAAASKPGTSAGAGPGTPAAAKPGGAAATGAKGGTITNSKAGGAAGAKPGAATGAKAETATGAKGGAAANAKAGGAVVGRPGTAAASGKPGGAAASKTAGRPAGGTSKVSPKGNTHNFNASGKKVSVETKSGTRANLDRSGRVSTIHTTSGMTINHGAHGERRFETRRRDGTRVVGYGHGRGYAERGYYRGGHPYMRRTYYYGGHSYAYAYRGYYYRGNPYYGYVPPVYYAPAYYGWAYNPWPAPVAYGWGWGGSPWYGYYGGYFAPAPVYPYPALWLTDYLLAANLQAAYEAQAAGGALNLPAASDNQPAYGGGGDEAPTTLTPELKEKIAQEIKMQIAAEKEAAAHPDPGGAVSSTPPSGEQTGPDETPAALDPNHRIFVVSQVVSSSNPDGTECSLSPGDILSRVDDTADDDNNVKVLVASSQKNDCAAGSQVPVGIQDLQDMHNDFRAKITEGLGKLAENQGKNGIPKGPPAASKPNPTGQAQPDLTVGNDLKAQEGEAGQAEKEVQEAASDGGSD
jgi:hypothetical protein